MVLVLSRQDKVCTTKWYHSCQPRWLPVSHNTLVQEGNYLSHTRHPAKCLLGQHAQGIGTQTCLQRGHTY